MPQRLQVMLSSTAQDLPEHRKELVEACLRQDAFPLRMEDLPANSEKAAAASLRMVEAADIYVGVFAHRYGYVPKANNPAGVSVTEIEYNRAVERKIERLIFIMDKSHSITVDDVEIENAEKLKEFKDRVCAENVVRFFRSPADLRAEAINSLSKLRQPDLTDISEIPSPPQVFIAHPYTLLQTATLVGRQHELKLLTDWANGKELESEGRIVAGSSVRIMNVIGIGGTGKSALTWKWFNDIAPEEIQFLSGRMWWSFYESDATFENFITRALAYISGREVDEVRQIPAPERERKLLAIMDREPLLIVLDGLERTLIAYARMDAARLDDIEVGKEKNLRRTADPRVGGFLRKVTQLKQGRIIISSRLSPAELETETGDPRPETFRLNLEGLTDEDALELWSAFDVSGFGDELVSIFNTFARHPLLLQVLAGEVKRYRKAPGDFTEWRRGNPLFDPGKFRKVNEAMGHILGFALCGLDERSQKVLQTLAAFRMPTSYDTMFALTVGKNKACADEPELDAVLIELEDRGLLGWDKRANRYDLHPIVRGAVWNGLTADAQRGVFRGLHAYFESLPKIGQEIDRLEDLTPVIELYNTLIGLGRFDDAYNLFASRLYRTALYRFNASLQCAELLEMLFSNKLDSSSYLKAPVKQAAALTVLGLAYDWSGRPGRTVPLLLRANIINKRLGSLLDLCVNSSSLSSALQLTGRLRESEVAARTSLQIARTISMPFAQASSLYWLGLVLSARSASSQPGVALYRALAMTRAGRTGFEEATTCAFIAEYWTRRGDFNAARRYADLSWKLAERSNYRRLYIRAARRQGIAALRLGDLASAEERLNLALARARSVNFAEEELPALIGLSESRRLQNDRQPALMLLDDVWELAERGPYPLFHADALNVLAQIERDEGNMTAAVEAATRAYRVAWCDGPPFAYHWGLEKAKKHLRELGALEPELPPFDASHSEPMPEVDIDPDDEFHVGEISGSESQ